MHDTVRRPWRAWWFLLQLLPCGYRCLGVFVWHRAGKMKVFAEALYPGLETNPGYRFGLQRCGDSLYFRVVIEHFFTHFATPAGLFISAKGREASKTLWQLIHTVPALMRRAILWAVLRSRVQTLAARPNVVLFASRATRSRSASEKTRRRPLVRKSLPGPLSCSVWYWLARWAARNSRGRRTSCHRQLSSHRPSRRN